MNTPVEDEAATLLAAQLVDLARYRHLLEAQRAVLRMADAGLLGRFTSEADSLISGIVARDAQLLSVRVAAQAAAAQGPRAARIADLHAHVQRERALAGGEAQRLAAEINRAKPAVAEAIRRSEQDLQVVFCGYASVTRINAPSMIDRRG